MSTIREIAAHPVICDSVLFMYYVDKRSVLIVPVLGKQWRRSAVW